MLEPTYDLVVYESRATLWSSRVELRAKTATFIVRQSGTSRRDEVDLRLLHHRPTFVEETKKQWIGMGVGLCIAVLALLLEDAKKISIDWAFPSIVLGGAVLFWYLFNPVGVWAIYYDAMGQRYGFLKGRKEEEFDQFLGVMENRILAAKGEGMINWVRSVRKVTCALGVEDRYQTMLNELNGDNEPPHYPRIELIGRMPTGEFVERWSFFSPEARAGCEEWLRETTTGQAFARQWTDLGAQPGDFEDWTLPGPAVSCSL